MEGRVIGIDPGWLRVEFNGDTAVPAKLVVPLVVGRGRHKDLRITAEPRSGVRLGSSVETGDALTQTFTTGWSGNVGGSFFGSIGYGRTRSTGRAQYSAFMSPNFRSVIFLVPELDVDEDVGIQVAFPVEAYAPDLTTLAFATVSLEAEGALIGRYTVSQEVHPKAARTLVLNSHPRDTPRSYDPGSLLLRLPLGPFVEMWGSLEPKDGAELVATVATGFDILHVVSGAVQNDRIGFWDFGISAYDFFQAVDRGGIRLVFLSTCNSVNVVSAFRRSNADALIAATEQLMGDYAHVFEREFYATLSLGRSVGEAFSQAVTRTDRFGLAPDIRSGHGQYSPMFLDLKRDIAFGVEASQGKVRNSANDLSTWTPAGAGELAPPRALSTFTLNPRPP